MGLDYSKAIMVGNGWATRDATGELTLFSTAFEAAGGEIEAPEPEAPVFETLADWLKSLDAEPLVRDAKDAGFDVSGKEIDEAWKELNAG